MISIWGNNENQLPIILQGEILAGKDLLNLLLVYLITELLLLLGCTLFLWENGCTRRQLTIINTESTKLLDYDFDNNF